MKTTIIRTLTVIAVTLIGTGASMAGGGNAGFGPLSHAPNRATPGVKQAAPTTTIAVYHRRHRSPK